MTQFNLPEEVVEVLPGESQHGWISSQASLKVLSNKVFIKFNILVENIKDGNWENGGPNDMARFIGDKVHNLIRMLDQD